LLARCYIPDYKSFLKNELIIIGPTNQLSLRVLWVGKVLLGRSNGELGTSN